MDFKLQDVNVDYAPLSPSTPMPKKSVQNFSAWIAAVVILAFVIILLSLLLIFRKQMCLLIRKKKAAEPTKSKERTQLDQVVSSLGRSGSAVTCFDYGTLKSSTKNFHEKNKLGCGGFGTVYKGTLQDGSIVAIKRLERAKQGDTEFYREVKLITGIQHKNLVRLIGCCAEEHERLLVYEYMSERSLDRFIYGNTNEFLPWPTRYEIILGVARGLQYLHEDSHIRIVHRDIKASNILLDEKFQPRIADFGLARFFADDGMRSTQFAGTLGYTAPEYAIRGELSEKADIYSFGVLVLEIVSCRKNTDLTLPSGTQYLPELAWKLYEEDKILDLVDERMREGGYVKNEVLRVLEVAFRCIQAPPHLRPAMSQVTAMFLCQIDMATMKMTSRYDELPTWESISLELHSPISNPSTSH
ncbi:hypothetical protein SUGI_0537030 [Cryptomeria japonica]|nr:hypothetical protein SUGI_0537030 [Cryptomeria japonica]